MGLNPKHFNKSIGRSDQIKSCVNLVPFSTSYNNKKYNLSQNVCYLIENILEREISTISYNIIIIIAKVQ